MSDISTNYELEIEILSPLHVGSGVVLRRGFEYVTQGAVTYRLNDRAILDDMWPDDEAQQRQLLDGSLADLLIDVELAKRPEYVLYQYRGQPTLGEIREHIRDVYGRAYLPGSSLKGALRTAIMRTIIEGVQKKLLTREDIGPAMRDERDARSATNAAEKIEVNVAGRDPNTDLFRALSVGDTAAAANVLALQKIQVVPGLDVDVEVIPAGTKLRAPVRVDKYLLRTVREQLHFAEGSASAVGAFVKATQFTAEDRIRRELSYHSERNQIQPFEFYTRLKELSAAESFNKSSCLVQVGFATGWRAKSVLGNLSRSDPLLEQVVREFHLDRGGKGGATSAYEQGQDFPRARHLAYRGDMPAEPMGWVRITATRV